VINPVFITITIANSELHMTYNPNDDIVKKLYPVIKEQTEGMPDQKYWEFVAAMAESGNPLDPRQVADKIIQSFPWPIGVELRRLFSGDKRELNKDRRDQALKVAEKATQFIALVLLAQLWEEVKNKKINITPDFKQQFKLKKPSFGIWAGLVRAIHSIFENQRINPFTDHFSNKCFSNRNFIKQMEKLVEMRNDIAHGKREWPPEEVEESLKEFLCNIAFLVRYKLVAVSEIEVLKSRLSNVMYKHSFRILNSSHEDFISEDKEYDSFFESHIVLLFKDFASPKPYLNLSPFIIDTSAYLKNKRVDGIRQGVYVYNDMVNESFNYYFTNANETSVMNNLPLFNEIENEFRDLIKALEYE